MTGKELLDTIYIKLESYATNLNDTYNDLVQNDLDGELEFSANEIMNEKIIVFELMYKIPKLEKELELLTKYKSAFEILKKIVNDGYIDPEMGIFDSIIDLSKEEEEYLKALIKENNHDN